MATKCSPLAVKLCLTIMAEPTYSSTDLASPTIGQWIDFTVTNNLCVFAFVRDNIKLVRKSIF